MRDFNNLDLLVKIENNPSDYIIQRKVSLLDSYLFAYDSIIKIKDLEIFEMKYKSIPSMQEYAIEKYNGKNIGTRNFKSIIAYNCENELEYYSKYLQFIKEYEEKYLLEDVIVYIANENKKYSLKDIINNMQKRFPAYFGNYDLENFRAFFDGYIKCKEDYKIETDEYENSIIRFIKNIKCTILDMEGKHITWDRKYRYNKDWNSWGQIDGNIGKEIINKFFEDLRKYIG
ncbi:hypothetical protein ACYULU_07130 [Breznakiellaceae bacterium SP9]